MMRNLMIVLNSILAVFFSCLLAYTFFARQHLESLARDFITTKTLHYSKPIVEVADQSLDSPVVKRLLSDKQSAVIREEITEYRKAPSEYISDLTRQKMLAPNPQNPNPLLQKVASIKQRIRLFYDNTLAALVFDLRIFLTSNLCAVLIAAGLAFWSRENIQKSIVWFSVLMFATVIYCSYMYVDGLTFFRILFRLHDGWAYPLFLCVIVAGMYFDFGRVRLAAEQAARSDEEREITRNTSHGERGT